MYKVPTQPVGVGTRTLDPGVVVLQLLTKSNLFEKKLAYVTIQAVDVAGGVTAKFVFLHAEVRDVNVDARSVLEMRGICSFVCICLRKQSSHVTVDTLNTC